VKSKHVRKKSLPFSVNVQGGDIVLRFGNFRAIYYTGQQARGN
jgi:hypothetical protein